MIKHYIKNYDKAILRPVAGGYKKKILADPGYYIEVQYTKVPYNKCHNINPNIVVDYQEHKMPWLWWVIKSVFKLKPEFIVLSNPDMDTRDDIKYTVITDRDASGIIGALYPDGIMGSITSNCADDWGRSVFGEKEDETATNVYYST